MKIKDMEKLTGLSQRSIRLYEEKGLLDVKRNDENQYRTYTEEDLERLKLIRVLRYFDFSIDEIGELLAESDNAVLIDALSKKADAYADVIDDYESKAEQCRALVKDLKKSENADALDDYIEMIGSLDDEDVKELKEIMKGLNYPTIGGTIIWTLVFLGPILTALINGRTESTLQTVLLITSSVFITLDWSNYFRGCRRNKNYQNERDKGSIWLILALVACISITIIALVGIDAIHGYYLNYRGDKWMYYEPPWSAILMLIIFICIIGVSIAWSLLYRLTGNSIFEFGETARMIMWKHKAFTALVAVILLYIGIFNINVVTEDTLIKINPLHPQGIVYNLSQVKGIKTGFDKSGNFYYTIDLQDTKMKLTGGTINEDKYPQYKEYDYLEFADLDQRIMRYGIPKEADVESISRAYYSETCMENLKKVVNNEGLQSNE